MENIYQKWDVPLYQEYCQKFHLPQEQKIREFSRGMKMKLSIAVALSHHPDLLILDEATAGLDPVCREEILDLLLGFIQDEEHAVLISTHITSDLDKIADYITFIHQGRIVFSRPKDELRDEMGIAKCTEEEFKAFDSTFIVRYRRHQFGVEALIRDRQIFTMRYSGISVDPVSTESVMLFYSRGTEV
jgi:ABC-2 type transport system ATP-binding protein